MFKVKVSKCDICVWSGECLGSSEDCDSFDCILDMQDICESRSRKAFEKEYSKYISLFYEEV